MRRRLLTLVLLAVIPLAAVIAYGLVHLYDRLQQAALDDAGRHAEELAVDIDRYTLDLQRDAETVGRALIDGGMTETQARDYFSSLANRLPPSDYIVLDPDGSVLAAARPSAREARFDDDPAVRQVLASGEGTVTALRDLPDGFPGFAVFTPIEDPGGIKAVAGVFVHVNQLAVLAPERPAGTTVIVTDGAGRAMYVNDQRVDEEAIPRFDPVRRALQGDTNLHKRITVPGLPGERVGAQAPAPPLGWTVGYYLQRSDAFGEVSSEIALTSAIVLGILAFVLLITRSYGLSITEPLAKLTAAADEVRRGRFDAPIEIRRNDEIGKLAEDFRRMQVSLAHTFHEVGTLSEATGRINSSLEIQQILPIAFGYLRDVLDAPAVVATLVKDSGRGVDIHVSGMNETAARDLSASVETMYPKRMLHGLDHLILDLAEEPLASLPPLAPEPRYLVVLPLFVRSRLVGRIDAYCSPAIQDTEFRSSAVPLAVSFSRQLAIAIANARLFESQQLIADTLQDSLLSEPYPLEGIDVAVLYSPATIGARIGGDFYDFIPVGEHAMAVVVGDISGKGIDAARYTALAKGAIRTLAFEDPWPASVLRRASRVIAEQTAPDTFVTAVYALIDAQTGHLHYANAGHPPPLLSDARGGIRTLLGHGPPLGVMEMWRVAEGEARLAEGDRLLLYTDGLTEARRGIDMFGSEGVARAAIEARPEPLEAVPQLLALRAAEHAKGRLTDDVAVVVVEKTRRAEEDGSATRQAPAGGNASAGPTGRRPET